MWLMRPMRALKCLPHTEQVCSGAVVAIWGWFFLLALLSTASSVRFVSAVCAPSLISCLQIDRSAACSSQPWMSIWRSLKEAFRVSLYLFFCPPTCRLPCFSSPYINCFGIRQSAILCTCPAHLAWDFSSNVWIELRPVRSSTSVSGILSCHRIPKIFLRHPTWEWFSFCVCLL